MVVVGRELTAAPASAMGRDAPQATQGPIQPGLSACRDGAPTALWAAELVPHRSERKDLYYLSLGTTVTFLQEREC